MSRTPTPTVSPDADEPRRTWWPFAIPAVIAVIGLGFLLFVNRGPGITVSGENWVYPGGRPAAVLSGLVSGTRGPLRYELADTSGARVQQGEVPVTDGRFTVTLEPAAPASYRLTLQALDGPGGPVVARHEARIDLSQPPTPSTTPTGSGSASGSASPSSSVSASG